MIPQISIIPQCQVARPPDPPEETPHVDFTRVDAHLLLLFAHVCGAIAIHIFISSGCDTIVSHFAVAKSRQYCGARLASEIRTNLKNATTVAGNVSDLSSQCDLSEFS
mmetsp:Transcript_26172/g.56421  ORF Transcript_26172/g.56421 Transcript_26172/m.56421 type:complete len:108 (+) Transcript_26172:423-746(+)